MLYPPWPPGGGRILALSVSQRAEKPTWRAVPTGGPQPKDQFSPKVLPVAYSLFLGNSKDLCLALLIDPKPLGFIILKVL